VTRPDWQRTERQIAGRLGGVRVPVSGRGRGDVPDIAHPLLSVECKHRATLPGWLHMAMAQATAAAQLGQIPVTVLHQAGQRHDTNLCVLRLSDLAGLLERHIPDIPEPDAN
jgi:hypothetical protein